MEKAIPRPQKRWIARLFTRIDQRFPDGAGIGGGEGGTDRGTPTQLILSMGGFDGEEDSGFTFSGFQKRLCQHALFPIMALHR
jgi:hypothetical protein